MELTCLVPIYRYKITSAIFCCIKMYLLNKMRMMNVIQHKIMWNVAAAVFSLLLFWAKFNKSVYYCPAIFFSQAISCKTTKLNLTCLMHNWLKPTSRAEGTPRARGFPSFRRSLNCFEGSLVLCWSFLLKSL